LSRALGQPVSIGTITAGVYPRVTMRLGDVAIGQPPRITARTLDVGTGLRALFSRRIEGANLRLEGARIELPLPEFAMADTGASDSEGSAAPVQIVSIDDITLDDVEVVSGGRTLRGDIHATVRGPTVTLTSATLQADGSTLDVSGEISDVGGPVGELTVTAGAVNVDNLLAFASDFSTGLGGQGSAPAADDDRMNLAVNVNAERATFGLLGIERFTTRAAVTRRTVALDPVRFGLFRGTYNGRLDLRLTDDQPAFQWRADLAGIDLSAVTSFLGSRQVMTGRMAGVIDIAGRGSDASAALRSARGTARVDVRDGIVRNLGMVRSIVIATSGRAGTSVSDAQGPSDEPFSSLSATLAVANGTASTQDLRFVSDDLLLTAAGGFRLDGNAINLAGTVQLSEELTKRAGRDLVRYTQEQGRVTLPITISGPAVAPIVRVDVAGMAGRAIRNRATEEAEKAIKKGLEGLIRR
jgi:uncharacterized protein involved in outer membrane biogenesis